MDDWYPHAIRVPASQLDLPCRRILQVLHKPHNAVELIASNAQRTIAGEAQKSPYLPTGLAVVHGKVLDFTTFALAHLLSRPTDGAASTLRLQQALIQRRRVRPVPRAQRFRAVVSPHVVGIVAAPLSHLGVRAVLTPRLQPRWAITPAIEALRRLVNAASTTGWHGRKTTTPRGGLR